MATARPFAYNPGAAIPGTEQLGDLSIGAPTSGFTNSPQYWNGPDEELGYVIAQPVSGNTQPTPLSGVTASVGFYRSSALTESSFVELTNSVFGQSFTEGVDAKTWLNNNGYWTSYQSPLLVSLDAGNPSSYSGTGNIWYDLSGNNNDATLINTPTYSPSYNGILQFDDASLEYATIPNIGNLTNWTVEAWFRLTSPLTGKVTSIVSNQFNLTNKLNYSIGTNNMPSNNNLTAGYFDGSWHNAPGVVPNVNTWYQVVGTYDGSTIRQYVNGVPSGGTLNYVGTPQSGGEVRLMRRWDSALQSSNLVDGDLAIVKIYSEVLTDSDVLFNYNNTYSRFIDPTPTPTPTSTNTPTPSVTNTQTPTNTPTGTAEVTPTPTNTETPTNTPTGTAAVTPTPTNTRTPTNTPSVTPTNPGALRVLFLGDSGVNTVATNINSYITSTGKTITYSAVTMGTTYTGSGNITKSNYDVVMIYTNSGQIGTTTLANALTTFVGQGGSVVSGVFLWNLYATGYNFTGTTAFNVTNSQGTSVGNFNVVSATTITNGIGTALPASFSNSSPTIVSGGVSLATFTNGENCLALKTVGSSKNISINAWPGNINSSTSTITKMFGNSILYAGGKI